MPGIRDKPYDITAVIVNYNGSTRLLNTIRSLRAQSGVKLRVLVFDDGSTDDSIELVRNSGLADKISTSPVNTQYANRWRAAGFHEAATELVFITDNDLEFGPGCLAELARTFEKDPAIGAATPAIYDMHDRAEAHSLGSLTHFLALTIRLPDDGAPIVDSVGSGITMYSKSRVKGLGCYDKQMPMGWGSDNEFHQRIRLAGLRSVVNRRARVFHDFKPFSDARSYRVTGATHNRLRFIGTHYSAGTLVGLFPVLVIFEVFLLAYFTYKGLATKYFKGVSLFLRNRKEMMGRRRFVQGLRGSRDTAILYSGKIFLPAHARPRSRTVAILLRVLNAALTAYWRTLTRLTRL